MMTVSDTAGAQYTGISSLSIMGVPPTISPDELTVGMAWSV